MKQFKSVQIEGDRYAWLNDQRKTLILVTLVFSVLHQLIYSFYTGDWLMGFLGLALLPVPYFMGWILPGFVLGFQILNPFCTDRIFNVFVRFFLYVFLFSLVGTWLYYDLPHPILNRGGEFPFSFSAINLGAVYGVYFMYRKNRERSLL